MPPGASPLRVELLGRLAVVAAAIPGRQTEAHRLGDEAVAMARELDEPALLVQALADRHLAPSGPAGLAAKEAAGDEIAALGARVVGPTSNCSDSSGSTKIASTGATGMRPTGHWCGGSCWPKWCRRHSGATAQGSAAPACTSSTEHRAGAFRTIAEASHIGKGVVDDVERLGLELDGRVNVLRLWPGHDDRAAALLAQMGELTRPVPAPFVKVHVALAAAVLGDTTPASEVVPRYGAHAESLIEDIAGVLDRRPVGRVGVVDRGAALATRPAEHAAALRRSPRRRQRGQRPPADPRHPRPPRTARR